MRAAVLQAPGEPLEIVDCTLDPPGPGEVHVRIAASGVCHSDLNFVDGSKPYPLPVVLGHEASGTVLAVGEGVRRVRPGDPVLLSFTPSCGLCANCRRAHPTLCLRTAHRLEGAMPDGTRRLRSAAGPVNHFVWLSTFAEEAVVPESVCVPVRPDAPLDKLCLIGCAVTTGVMSVLNVADVRPGDSVAVFGCGGVGLAAIMGARLTGAAEIIAVDPFPDRAELARTVGATRVIAATGADAVTEILALSGGVDVAFEATGVPAVIGDAMAACRDGGAAVIIGVPADASTTIPVPYSWLRRNRRLLGSYMGDAQVQRDIPALVDLYLAGRLPIDAMIGHVDPLSGINAAFERFSSGAAGRTIVDLDAERA